jgi:tetratricopeptide (TPR) repeat protein
VNEEVMEIFGIRGLAGLLLAFAVAAPSEATPTIETPFGAYLAGRHAQETRDYAAAASWYEDALKTDPESPELISRTFLMEASEGRLDRAHSLAEKELKLDPTDAVAELILMIDRIKAGDKAGALARAEALPAEGLHRFLGPLARAWMRMATGDLAGADAALRQLDKFNGFAPLEFYQLGLLYDFAGQPDTAEENFKKTLEATGQLNWRLTDAMANFYERHGRADEADALYQRFIKDNAGSELAESVLARKPAEPPPPSIDSAEAGLAEALFDLASVLNQPESIDLALLYARCAI